MRVFIDLPTEWNSGFETHIKQFLKHIDKHLEFDEIIMYGHTILISDLQNLSNNVNYVIDNSIPFGAFNSLRWRQKTIPKILKFYTPDIHLNFMGWIHHSDTNVKKVGMNRNLQPFIPETVSSNPFYSKEYIRLKLYKQTILNSYNRCDGVIFNSEYAKEKISPYLKTNISLKVINHGVNEHFFCKPRDQTKTNNLTLLYISDFYPYKNHEVLICAIDNVRKHYNLNVSLICVGQLNQRYLKLKNRIERILGGFPEWLSVYHKVPNNNLKDFFLASDFFVYPSSVESFGHSLVEAMTCGMPILCSNKRPMIDFLGYNANVFNEKSISDVTMKIVEYAKNPVLRQSQALKNYEEAKKFSYDMMTKETIVYLRTLTEK